MERAEKANRETRATIKNRERKCLSQPRHVQVELNSILRTSYEDEGASRKSAKRFHIFNFSSKGGTRAEETSTSMERRSKKKYKLVSQVDENDYKSMISRLARENRRLHTEHVREIYTKEVNPGRRKDLEVS